MHPNGNKPMVKLLTILLLIPSISFAFDENWIWEISCKEKEFGTVYQYRVSTDMVQERTDFGVWKVLPDYDTQEVIVEGSDTTLLISTMSDSVLRPETIHLVWWNYSNPSSYNSYKITPSWSQSGSVSTTIQYFNCNADKNPKENFNGRIGFISRTGDIIFKRNLDGSVWSEYKKNNDDMRKEFLKENEKKIYEDARRRLEARGIKLEN